MDPERFVETRLERAIDARGHWAHTPEGVPDDAMDLMDALRDGVPRSYERHDVFIDADGALREIDSRPWGGEQ